MNTQQASCSQPGLKYSFEFFPPRDAIGTERFWKTLHTLSSLSPNFVSVTSGAGGTSQNETLDSVVGVQQKTRIPAAAHLTCASASREEIKEKARHYWDAGISHIVALRGDAPGGGQYHPHPQGYAYASDLVSGLRKMADFEITVAAYPEVHPQARNAQSDLDNLKRKIDAGATRAITQFFFDSDVYLRFVDRARAAGIEVPIVPGILPVTNYSRVHKMARECGASIPSKLDQTFRDAQATRGEALKIAETVMLEQCRYLRWHGVDTFHFYTLNNAEPTESVCRQLNLSAADAHSAAPRIAEA